MSMSGLIERIRAVAFARQQTPASLFGFWLVAVAVFALGLYLGAPAVVEG